MAIDRYLSVGGRVWMIGFNNFGGIDELGAAEVTCPLAHYRVMVLRFQE